MIPTISKRKGTVTERSIAGDSLQKIELGVAAKSHNPEVGNL